MRERRREDAPSEGAERTGAGGTAGKRTRTERLAPASPRSDGDAPASSAASTGALDERQQSAPAASHEDPFGMHLLGTSAASNVVDADEDGAAGDGDQAPQAGPQPVGAADAPGEDAASQSDASEGGAPAEDGAVESGTGDNSEGVAAAEPAAGPVVESSPTPDAAGSEPASANDAATEPAPADAAGADMDVAAVARAQAALIQTHAANEHVAAVGGIGQREQLLRSTFAQQRAAVTTVAATQVGLARSEAKAAAERVRGRNGAVGKTISQMIDGEAARLSHATQDAMQRVTVASKAVFPLVDVAAHGALANANLDLADANEGQLANELYQRLIPKARTAARNEVTDARARDIDQLASSRDSNIRQMRRAGDMLTRQVSGELSPVAQQFVAGGEQLAALINNNAQSQLTAIAAAERDAATFFARARGQARQLLDAGRKTAAAVTSAAASQSGNPGAVARFQAAGAQASSQLSGRRERLLAAVDSVADRVTSAVAHGTTEFRGECEAHRALAQGNYAAIEGALAGNLGGTVGQIRAEWAKETDVAIVSANGFAAIVESNRVTVAAQLPAKFGGIVRSAFSEARKSRLTRFGEGVWGAVSGLVTTLAKFVAAALIIMFAPIAFGVAALIGKAGALAAIVRDAAMAVVAMAEAFAERFRVLFRTWDDWPWYGKVAGLWATTLVAVGDTIGLPSIFEGVTGRELISNRELSYDERGAKTGGGAIAAVATFVPAKVQADKAARNARAFQMGSEVGELEARAAASQAEAKAASAADNAAGNGVDEASKVRGPGENPVVMAGDELDLYQYADRIPPVPGMLDVVLHGSLDEFYVVRSGQRVPVSHRALARHIRESGVQFERIRLISCETGAHTKGAAQHLSNTLGVDVYAPTEKIIIKPDGSYVIGPKIDVPRGHWQKFSPTKSEFRYTPAKEPPAPDLRERFRLRREQHAAQAADPARSQRPAAASAVRGGEAKTIGRDRMRELADSFNEQALDELDRADAGSGSLFDEYGPETNVADDPVGVVDDGGRPASSVLPPRHRDLLETEHQGGVTTRSDVDAQQSGIVPDEGAVYSDQHHVFPDEHRAWFEDPNNVKQDPRRPFDVDDYAMDIEHELHGTIHAGRGQWAGEWNARILNALQRERKLLGRPLTIEDMKVVASRELAAMGITEKPFRRYIGTKDTAARRESKGRR